MGKGYCARGEILGLNVAAVDLSRRNPHQFSPANAGEIVGLNPRPTMAVEQDAMACIRWTTAKALPWAYPKTTHQFNEHKAESWEALDMPF